MYPEILQPKAIESFLVNGQIIEIPKCIVSFGKWEGAPIKETFGGKPVVEVNGCPMFAELAIMTQFVNDGWQARWVETYGKKKPICLSEWRDDKYKNQVHQPFQDNDITSILESISKINSNSYAGCWDVVATKKGKMIFAESKRINKDKIRMTQASWLESALKYGLSPNDFLVVQWDFK